MALPVDIIRSTLESLGADEERILRRIEDYRRMDRKEQEKFLDTCRKLLTFNEVFKVLEDNIDIKYDDAGVPTIRGLKKTV